MASLRDHQVLTHSSHLKYSSSGYPSSSYIANALRRVWATPCKISSVSQLHQTFGSLVQKQCQVAPQLSARRTSKSTQRTTRAQRHLKAEEVRTTTHLEGCADGRDQKNLKYVRTRTSRITLSSSSLMWPLPQNQSKLQARLEVQLSGSPLPPLVPMGLTTGGHTAALLLAAPSMKASASDCMCVWM
eukprot:3358751-Amphidinium_carterae.2